MNLEPLSYERTDWNETQKSIVIDGGQSLSGVFWKGTTVQRESLALALTTADEGLLAYDSTIKTLFIWSGTEWL